MSSALGARCPGLGAWKARPHAGGVQAGGRGPGDCLQARLPSRSKRAPTGQGQPLWGQSPSSEVCSGGGQPRVRVPETGPGLCSGGPVLVVRALCRAWSGWGVPRGAQLGLTDRWRLRAGDVDVLCGGSAPGSALQAEPLLLRWAWQGSLSKAGTPEGLGGSSPSELQAALCSEGLRGGSKVSRVQPPGRARRARRARRAKAACPTCVGRTF